MNKKFYRCGILVLLLAAVLTGVMGGFFDNQYINSRLDQTIKKWKVKSVSKDGDFYYEISLPEENLEGKSIAYSTCHFESEVRINDELIYSVKASNPQYNKSTGYRWNIIKLKQEDAGKMMRIRLIPVYSDIRPENLIYFGDEFGIYFSIIKEQGLRYLLAFLIFLIGVVLFGYSNWIVEEKERDESLVYFSVFAMLLAIWSMAESPISELIRIWAIQVYVVDHFALMLMPSAFLFFMNSMFTIKDKLWKIIISFNVAVVVIRIGLQLTALCDLRETLWMTQISIFLMAVITIIWYIKNVLKNDISAKRRQNMMWIVCMFVATVFELLLFVIFGKNVVLGMIGFACYIHAMAFEVVKSSRLNMKRAQEAEVYRKLAFIDDLTGAYNRTAFQRDIDNQWEINPKTGKKVMRQITIFMFDLNDLKKCNDTYGHEYGDQYIRRVAEVLLHAVGVTGHCYRIGGDEFCAMFQNLSQTEVDGKMIQILRELQELDKQEFVVPIRVAMGYATFNSQYDDNLEDTMKRADMLMYQNKQKMKSKERA